MNGVYMSSISRIIEIALAVSGITILIFAARAFLSSGAWGDGAEYEMLGLPAPERDAAEQLKMTKARIGQIGVEDRVVRLGFSFALGFLSITWFGIGSLAMWAAALPILYFFSTGVAGKDPLYRKLGVTTRFD